MPQLDVATFLPQLFWLAASFLVLYLLMKFLALPRVGAALAARRSRIEDDLARAGALKAEAEAAFAAYEKSLAAARSKAQAMLRESAEEFAAEAARRQRDLAQRLAAEAAAAEKEIAAAKERALEDLKTMAFDLAREIADKLLQGPLSAGGASQPLAGRES